MGLPDTADDWIGELSRRLSTDQRLPRGWKSIEYDVGEVTSGEPNGYRKLQVFKNWETRAVQIQVAPPEDETVTGKVTVEFHMTEVPSARSVEEAFGSYLQKLKERPGWAAFTEYDHREEDLSSGKAVVYFTRDVSSVESALQQIEEIISLVAEGAG